MKTLRNILIVVSTSLVAFQLAGDDSFNCHNYAWETERRWLDDPSEYIAAATECEPDKATHVVYYDKLKPTHSGVYLGSGWAKSKWGGNAIVFHPVFFAPYHTSNIRYYR